jgi:transcriptional regulator with XRE-family HTH domain
MTTMDFERCGRVVRAVRIRRRWRQFDVATHAHVHRSMVSRIERGHGDHVTIAALERVAAALDIRLTMNTQWRGGDLDRLLSAAHSALHERVADFFADLGGWDLRPEVSFSIGGERGVIDILAWHAATRTLLVIELKTEIADVNDLMTTMGRRLRLAARVGRDLNWVPAVVAGWVIVADTSTNRRRVRAHAKVLRNAFPADGSVMRGWVRTPSGPVRGLSFWSSVQGVHANPLPVTPKRVRARPEAPG